MNLAQFTLPCVDQSRRQIVPPRDLGDAGTGRESLGRDLQPLLVTPTPAPLRPGKHPDLTHSALTADGNLTTLHTKICQSSASTPEGSLAECALAPKRSHRGSLVARARALAAA